MNYSQIDATPSPPKSIGGWLWIPAIGLVLSPIILVVSDLLAWTQIQAAMPAFMDSSASKALIAIDLVSLILTLIVAVQFFSLSPAALETFSTLLAYNCLAAFVVAAVTAAHFDTNLDLKGLIRSGVYAAVWIPYFNFSKRVQHTFASTPLQQEASV